MCDVNQFTEILADMVYSNPVKIVKDHAFAFSSEQLDIHITAPDFVKQVEAIVGTS